MASGTYKYYLGSDIRVYISTEVNAVTGGAIAVDRTTGICTVGDDDGFATTFIESLAAVAAGAPSTDSKQIANIESLELETGKNHQESKPVGRHTTDKIYIGDKCTATMTLNMSDESWRYLYKQADNGIDPDGNLLDSSGPTVTTAGFRIFVLSHKNDNGEKNLWETLMNCRITDCKLGTPAQEVQTLQMVFEGIKTESKPTPYTDPTTDAEL